MTGMAAKTFDNTDTVAAHATTASLRVTAQAAQAT
jgi:hypothetical protein